MKKNAGFFLFLFFAFGFLIYGKDCPSSLFANLNQLGNSNLFWGIEFKSFLYNYEGNNYYFGGISAALNYESENTSFQFEAILKKKKYVPCDDIPEISPFNIRRLNIEKYIGDNLSINLGRQEITVGTGLVLDDFFDGISFRIGRKNYLEAGGGVYSIYVSKEAMGCQKCFFYNYRPCWKNLAHTEWGDIFMGFINYTFRVKRNEFSLMYLRAETKDENMKTHTLSIYSRLRLKWKIQFTSEFAVQKFDEKEGFAYGFNSTIMRRIKAEPIGLFLLKLRYLYGSSNETLLFTPLFGTTYMGARQHFSVRQGNIFGGEIKYTPKLNKKLSLKFGYYLNSKTGLSNFISDEFDTTLELNLDKKEKFKIMATYAIWSGVFNGSQFSVNIRIVI